MGKMEIIGEAIVGMCSWNCFLLFHLPSFFSHLFWTVETLSILIVTFISEHSYWLYVFYKPFECEYWCVGLNEVSRCSKIAKNEKQRVRERERERETNKNKNNCQNINNNKRAIWLLSLSLSHHYLQCKVLCRFFVFCQHSFLLNTRCPQPKNLNLQDVFFLLRRAQKGDETCNLQFEWEKWHLAPLFSISVEFISLSKSRLPTPSVWCKEWLGVAWFLRFF